MNGTELIDELRELRDDWKQVYEETRDAGDEYNDGMAEGAKSAALELNRVIERHEVDGNV